MMQSLGNPHAIIGSRVLYNSCTLQLQRRNAASKHHHHHYAAAVILSTVRAILMIVSSSGIFSTFVPRS